MVLLGLAGRKGSGKSTLTNFLLRNAGALFGDPNFVVDFETPRHVTFVSENPGGTAAPVIGQAKAYALADPFKEFCVEVLGLTTEQCYGTDAEKNTLTRYRWEDMPHHTDLMRGWELAFREKYQPGDGRHLLPACDGRFWAEFGKHGPMTARQVMQEVGTGIGRRMHKDIWVEACLRSIRNDNAELAVIDDVRFPNEVDAIRAAGGKVVRLHRAPYREDEHESETALDFYEPFDAHILGRHDTPWKACNNLLNHLQAFGWLSPEELPGRLLDKMVGPDGRPMYGPHRGEHLAA
jgi:hypothetical protein